MFGGKTFMNPEDYEKFRIEAGAINLAHPEFDKEYHKDTLSDVTVVIPQRKTKDFTQLCVESLLRFYPDIKMLIIDGDSQDDSTLYIMYKALTNPNITYYNHIGRNSHGEILDYAIHNLVTTHYMLTMDSDTITNRGGWIEQLLKQFEQNDNLYATGSLMLVSYNNYGVGLPQDESDILRYAHPSCSMYRISIYKQLELAWNDNGAPLGHNMREAKDKGLEIDKFPIDKYVRHRTGSSWVKEHQIVWANDYDVPIRPFITFLIDNAIGIYDLKVQTDKDFNMVVIGENREIRIWETSTRDINNPYYDIRFSVTGEYVILLNDNSVERTFAEEFKKYIITAGAPKIGKFNDIQFYERKYFQNYIALF
jgi:hypothetical protein